MRVYPFVGLIPDLKKVRFDEVWYESMRMEFNTLIENGYFKTLSTIPSYFILRIKTPVWTSIGIITLTSIQEYTSEKIRQHEQTIAKKKKLHVKLLTDRRAMIKPAAVLISAYVPLETWMSSYVNQHAPIFEINYPDHQTRHALWLVNRPKDIQFVTDTFKTHIKTGIIADGHHRFASMASLGLHSKILTVFFTPDEMHIDSFYRILTPLKAQSSQALLLKLQSTMLRWKEVPSVQPNHAAMQLVHANKVYQFNLPGKDTALLPVRFTALITNDLFKIQNESRSKRIHYEEIPASVSGQNMVFEKWKDHFLFILPSLSTTDVLKNKTLLPPKSTFFTPRIINGLVISLLEVD